MEISEILLHNTLASEKPFQCHFQGCCKSFGRKSDLVRHCRIHTNDKPFRCQECNKRFIQRSALTVHKRTHSGERPHQCEYCLRRFSDSSSMARHRRIHTGKRPYRCTQDGCNKSFVRKTMLIQHFKQQHTGTMVRPLPSSSTSSSASP